MLHYNSLKRQQEAELSELTDHYDMLYRKVHCLFDDVDDCPGVMRSQVENSPDLFLHVIARHKYTTIFHLTHFFENQGAVQANPAALFRLYHDAHSAEAVACFPDTAIEPLTRPWTSLRKQVIKRLELNRFARKWLSFLLQQGHSRVSFREVAHGDIPISIESRVLRAHKNLDRVIQTA